MTSRKLRHRLAFVGALSFAAGLAQMSGCAEGTQQDVVDSGSDVIRKPRPNGEGGAGEGGVVCTATPCVIDIAAGGTHTCALIADGTVRCWGDGEAGELGSGDAGTLSESAKPVPVGGVAGATHIASGGQFATSIDYGVSCAGTPAGPTCWGSNEYGMLGRGAALAFDTEPHADPAVVTGFTTDAVVALGQSHACAIAGTSVSCWGSNTYQQLGQGPMDGGGPFATPVAVTLPAGKNPVDIAAGFAHTCVILDDKSVACWGYNGEAECGLAPVGSNYYQATPYVVPGVVAAHIAAASYHTCVVTPDGTVQCWGYDYMGLLGNPGDGGYAQGVLDIAMPGGKKAIQIAAGTETTCALLDDGTVACWGYDTYGQAGISPDSGTNVVSTPTLVDGVGLAEQISMGSTGQHACARIHGGSVKCWGANNYGQLGASSTEAGTLGTMSATPVDVQF